MVPIFDTIGLLDRFIFKTDSHSTINNMLHGGVTATGNFNVTAGLATVTFFSIIIAGVKKYGFIEEARNVPNECFWAAIESRGAWNCKTKGAARDASA